MNFMRLLMQKTNGSRTRKALNIYFTNKVLTHDEEKLFFPKNMKNWMCVLLSRIYCVHVLQEHGGLLTEILVTIDKMIM